MEGDRGRQASSSLWLGHLAQLWDGVEQAADPILGLPSFLPQVLPIPQPQFPQLYRGDTQGPLPDHSRHTATGFRAGREVFLDFMILGGTCQFL